MSPEVAKLYERREQVLGQLEKYSFKEVISALRKIGIRVSYGTLHNFAKVNKGKDRPEKWFVNEKLSPEHRQKARHVTSLAKSDLETPIEKGDSKVANSEPPKPRNKTAILDSSKADKKIISSDACHANLPTKGELIDDRPFLKMTKEEKMAHRLKFIEEDVKREAERDRRVEISLNEMDRK
ncbi:hypothetical protein VRRI112168_03430 [Vreelandella rituensis]|uniref:Uncharacterized protein n=1 Tax=Vreelandella rituensis TaxID=2282306 RepID=A0A368U9S2_9GAMM|nr:hypothetical protein DU506_00700 [Halomonas rituensis]